MHLVSTINPKTQSSEDIPVVVVTLDGKSKFLPRAETYKDMQHLVRAYYELDARVALRFEISTLDVCAGQSVEVTESVYALLAPLLDSVAVIVQDAPTGRHRVPATPSATPPLQGDEEFEEEQTVRHELEPDISQGLRLGSASPTPQRSFRMESDDEDGEDIQSRLDAAVSQVSESESDNSIDVKREASKKKISVKEEPTSPSPRRPAREAPREIKTEQRLPNLNTTRPLALTSQRRSSPANKQARPAADRRDVGEGSSRSSQPKAPSAEDPRFKVFITGPKSDQKAEFMTRGQHSMRKVLGGACKTFNIDSSRAKLLLCVPTVDEDGETVVHKFECSSEETVAHCGVQENAKLVLVIDEDDDDEEEEEEVDMY